jgi:hypothetical protein
MAVDLPFGFVESGGKVGPDAAVQFRPGESLRCAFVTLDRDGGRLNL